MNVSVEASSISVEYYIFRLCKCFNLVHLISPITFIFELCTIIHMPTLTIRERAKKMLEEVADLLQISQSRVIELGIFLVKKLIEREGVEKVRQLAYKLYSSYPSTALYEAVESLNVMFRRGEYSKNMSNIAEQLLNRIEKLERKVEELESKIDKIFTEKQKNTENTYYRNDTEEKHENNILKYVTDNPWINIIRSRQK